MSNAVAGNFGCREAKMTLTSGPKRGHRNKQAHGDCSWRISDDHRISSSDLDKIDTPWGFFEEF